ncbi:hypothetical protein DSM110093_02355 [Sulfitobacter sp. DSM 110093]|uniref:hypothetical protein n=1 Tax=Sulfitobacter sp. DSM 110093 TaxID=2883127 RepID=UPI001FAD614C|nr:hypothetical protein [Sulfitobacter sp. DSM 110093]UOA32555.1 hypothetical protein DSM110093_02355 [Sulfitobacter sp. DSM 110093]
MTVEPYGTTIFCDDIRHEINGKLTLVGCYSSEMNFNGPPPGLLPSFAALVNIRIPTALPFKSLKLRVLKEEGDEVSEILAAEVEAEEEKIEDIVGGSQEGEPEERLISMTFPCHWSPLPMANTGFIKVRAYLDGGKEIRLGALKINFASEPDAKD